MPTRSIAPTDAAAIVIFHLVPNASLSRPDESGRGRGGCSIGGASTFDRGAESAVCNDGGIATVAPHFGHLPVRRFKWGLTTRLAWQDGQVACITISNRQMLTSRMNRRVLATRNSRWFMRLAMPRPGLLNSLRMSRQTQITSDARWLSSGCQPCALDEMKMVSLYRDRIFLMSPERHSGDS